MNVKFVSYFTSFNLMINDNKILEKYLIDPSAAAMRVGRMDVKKERAMGLCLETKPAAKLWLTHF